MRRFALSTAALLAGCNQVLGLDPVAGRDGASADDAATVEDGAPDGAGPDAGCLNPIQRSFRPVADTTIIANDSQAHGDISVMNVSGSLASQALLLFDVSSIPTIEAVIAARVTLPFPAKATACADECGDCGSLETTGNLTMQFLRTDWDETASWQVRTDSATWDGPGAATFGVDRSGVTAAFPHEAATTTLVELPPALLQAWPTWRRNDRVAFVIAPAGGRAIIATREYLSLETCDGSLGQPTLTVDSCP